MSAVLPISVAMISGPDAGRIGRALESVRGWTAEQIVVVNDDVADGTDRIAEKLGAKVFREPWKEHIAQKNSAAAKATQPWILGLDSDEGGSGDPRIPCQNRNRRIYRELRGRGRCGASRITTALNTHGKDT